MKIDPRALTPDTTTRIDRDVRSAGESRPQMSGRSGDAVEVSSVATLAQAVAAELAAGAGAGGIRPEAVERGRAALADGSLGRDLDRLADRIIDDLLE